MCLVTSDTGAEVREWLEHYLRLGVGHFYVFDHNKQPISDAMPDLISGNIVEYFPVPVSLCWMSTLFHTIYRFVFEPYVLVSYIPVFGSGTNGAVERSGKSLPFNFP